MVHRGVLFSFAVVDVAMSTICGYCGAYSAAVFFGCAACLFALMVGDRGQSRQGS